LSAKSASKGPELAYRVVRGGSFFVEPLMRSHGRSTAWPFPAGSMSGWHPLLHALRQALPGSVMNPPRLGHRRELVQVSTNSA
jgi:hypothetical protein